MNTPGWLHETEQGVSIELYVSARASKTRLAGEHGGRLKLLVAAPPLEGAANREILRAIAKLCGVPRSAVVIRRGESSKRKTLEVAGVGVEAVAGRVSDA